MDKKAVRQALIEKRLNMPNRLERAEQLQQVLRFWLTEREDTVIGAYWPIKGEFDPLPALHRWKEDGELLEEPQRRRFPALSNSPFSATCSTNRVLCQGRLTQTQTEASPYALGEPQFRGFRAARRRPSPPDWPEDRAARGEV